MACQWCSDSRRRAFNLSQRLARQKPSPGDLTEVAAAALLMEGVERKYADLDAACDC